MLQPKILNVTPLEDYNILLEYDTSEIKVFNVKPYINGDWYNELLDINYFNRVKSIGVGIEWENGQDISPHELYENSMPLTEFRKEC